MSILYLKSGNKFSPVEDVKLHRESREIPAHR